MAKLILSLLLVFSVSGCASQLNNDWFNQLVNGADQPAKFNFDWQLSGYPNLLPLQVFDNGKKLWLQYPENTVAPALFARTKSGDLLLKPVRDGDFLVLKTIPDEIIIHGGIQTAKIARKKAAIADLSVKEQIAQVYALEAIPTKSEHALAKPAISIESNAVKRKAKPKAIHKKAPLPRLSAIPKEYSVSPKDINIRHALKTWSKNSEWTFSDEHWSVDVDIPIAGSASFGSAFQVAVRDLLAATELGDRPLQPCFYSNRVLRVVPMAQRCDRTSNQGVSL